MVTERGIAAWDIAAGVVLLEEAGGKVTTMVAPKIESGRILATNGHIHRHVMNFTSSSFKCKLN